MKLLSLLAGICLASASLAQAAQSPKDGSSDPRVLKRLEADWTQAQKNFAGHPKDPKVRAQYVLAGVRFGHESMMSPLLPAKVKYRQALHVYKQVLKVDPKNPVARPEADLMIRIYKSMGRPIPD